MRPTRSALLFALFAIAFLSHAPALIGTFPGALPSTGDTLGAFAPWHDFVRSTLDRYGAIPLWNPHLYGGLPFAANGQSALFYPPTYLHFLLPEGLALWLFALLHSYFLMLGGYFLGRTLGMSRRAAFLVAALLGLGNATPAHLFGGHLTFLPTRAFWPWQAAFLIRILRGDNQSAGTRNAIALAACLALGLAAGAPQLWLFGVLFCAAISVFWLFLTLKNRVPPRRWPWKPLLLAGFLTVLWCAPTLLPLRELKSWSSHGEALSFAEVTALSATPRSLFRLLYSGFFGGNSFFMWSLPSNPGEDGASLGLAAFLLAFLAPFCAPGSRVSRALWLGCGLVLLLALGNGTPLYRALYDGIGLFRIVRVPARWLELWAFGAALLAGLAFDGLLQNPRAARRFSRVWAGAAFFSIIGMTIVFLTRAPWQTGAKIIENALALPTSRTVQIATELQNAALLSCLIAAFTLGILAMLWRRGVGSKRHLALILALFCAEPLANFWLDVRVLPSDAVRNARLPDPIARKYRQGERWIVRAPFQQLNAPLALQIDALNGYEPFGSAPFFALAAAAQPGATFSADFQPREMAPLWRVMGASHILWKPKFEGDAPRGFSGKTVARAGEWRLNSLEDGLKPWPRAYLTRQISRVSGAQNLRELGILAARRLEVTPPATAESGFPALGNAPISPLETTRETLASPNLHLFQIAPAHDSLWVQNEVMAPGWRAFVDGKPAKIRLANAIFRGVSAPARARQVALVYNLQTLRFALFLAFCGLFLAAFLLTVAPKKT